MSSPALTNPLMCQTIGGSSCLGWDSVACLPHSAFADINRSSNLKEMISFCPQIRKNVVLSYLTLRCSLQENIWPVLALELLMYFHLMFQNYLVWK